jgi:hypothetical protein
MNKFPLETYYEMLSSKSLYEMKALFDAFDHGKYKDDTGTREALKAQLTKNPISFPDTLKKEKEIYDKLMEIL